MTPEERAAWCMDRDAEDVDSYLAPVDLGERIVAAIRAAVDAERERCARVAAFVLEHEPHKAATMPRLLRECPEMDVHDLSGPAKDIDLMRHEMPDRDGLWTYRHTDGALYYCTASESGDVLTWSRTPPQGDWGGTWECMEDDESGTNAGGES